MTKVVSSIDRLFRRLECKFGSGMAFTLIAGSVVTAVGLSIKLGQMAHGLLCAEHGMWPIL